MSQLKKYITLGVGHGINDCIAGYIIGCLFYRGFSTIDLGIYTLTYNLIAFGGQLLVARIIDEYYFPKNNLLISFILLICSLSFLNTFPGLSILFSGIASALFHVTGGMESCRNDDKAFGIGIFASPGVVGLIIGGLLAYIHFDFLIPGIIFCILYFLIIILFYKASNTNITIINDEPTIERHDIIMCILITIISLRSFVWDVVLMIKQNNYTWLIILAFSAMCGKFIGGFLADKIGLKKYTILALIISIPFLTILKKNIAAMSIGVFLLQSTIPSTTVMILKIIKKKPAIAISLSFGLSILIAVSLFYTPLISYLNNTFTIFIILFLSIILLLFYALLVKPKRV